ncbi:HlyD family secretion protein [Haliea sp. E1-2-M8]|uniref:HlyD family secretion protein n=1 Tax=Haliea sp. E1-2-M8 TaxID=3064706 RepID=UPI00271A7F84|nr:HlyD family secretion protein [Haliea sp. E1-2-M8]MDO8860375.1 HlyD family secretion protein [Haliea sp. E1-2-M8]
MTNTGKRQLGFGAGIAVAIAVISWFVLGGGGVVSTDNAYVKANKLALASEVSAIVKAVLVSPNTPVSQGQLLVQLEDQPFRLAVAEAEAHLLQVRNEVLARRADYAEIEAELAQAQEDAAFYQRQLARNQNMGPTAISESQLDESRQQLSRARAQIAIGSQRLASLRAALGGSPDIPLEQQADIMVAQAQLDHARYQLSRTRIVAPVAGVVANDVPQAGEMAPPGFTVITILETGGHWIEANLKETQLAAVHSGQAVDVTIDAYPGQVLRAEVDTVSVASGSEFALIPAQNASGNWVKVVQRIPVRLRLLDTSSGPTLRAGMSAAVRIHTHPTSPQDKTAYDNGDQPVAALSQ